MVTVGQIYDVLNALAPVHYQMDFDNSGFLIGDRNAEVHTVVTALDITDDVIHEAIAMKADLIVSHHPLLFHSLRNVRAEDLVGRKVLALAKHDISAICMHTNLDVADGGVNDALMQALNAEVTGLLEPAGTDDQGQPLGCGRVGTISEPVPLEAFLKDLTERLQVSGLRYCDGGKPVYRLAVCGGSGGNMLELAFEAGCDTFVTADIKYDRFLAAKEFGVNLIDADHFCTENVVVPVLAETIRNAFPSVNVRISQALGQTTQFYMP